MAAEEIRMTEETTGLAPVDLESGAAARAHVLATGDLSKLSNEQRLAYYLLVCESLGLNSLSRPFDWLVLDELLVLYPNKSCAEQLRRQHEISIKPTRKEIVGDLFVYEVEGRTPNGRTDFASKYVSLKDKYGKALVGNKLGDAFAKAETGAKRRLVLSMVGLASPPDPDEVENVRYVVVDGSGRVIEQPTDEQRALARDPRMAAAIGEPTYETTARASDAPFAASASSQAARADELERPVRAGDRLTFRPTDEDVRRWLGAWFASVKGLSLDDDDERHRFVEQWTDGRTRSLRNYFASATERQAADLLGHVRALMEDEKRILLEQAEGAPEDEQPLEAF
jgi:hypothetical protein